MATTQSQFTANLKRYYTFYTGGFVAFVIVLAILEQMGLPPKWIGYIFLAATIMLYAGIGIMSKTADVSEYYVAGRRVPAIFNGMATGADWMSAASFIGMAGTLYLSGFDGLAFILGWTGGYVLVALLLAPYLRKFGQFTIPDFLGSRYGGNLPRTIGVVAAIICSFVYVVAQIYGVGLITARLTGLEFQVGVFAGLAGILVCSFLGGMRAVTWTQVAQYIILIIAYMIPVVWLSVNITGNPIPQIAYGQVLEQVSAKEKELNDPTTTLGAAEASVRALHKEKQLAAEDQIKALEAAMAAGTADTMVTEARAKLDSELTGLKTAATPDAKKIADKEKEISEMTGFIKVLQKKIGPESPIEENLSKRLAQKLYGKIPVIWASTGTTEVCAQRWKGQINENAKAPAYWNVFPELNHNEIVGFEFPLEILNKIHVIILRDERDHPRVQKRIEITKGVIEDVVDGITEVWATGNGVLSRLFSLIYTGDYTSFYLAALYGLDPGPVKVIDLLKNKLAAEK